MAAGVRICIDSGVEYVKKSMHFHNGMIYARLCEYVLIKIVLE